MLMISKILDHNDLWHKCYFIILFINEISEIKIVIKN